MFFLPLPPYLICLHGYLVTALVTGGSGSRSIRSKKKPYFHDISSTHNQKTTTKWTLLSLCIWFDMVRNFPHSKEVLPKIRNVGSEDMPEIDMEEFKAALLDLKNGKASGDDGIPIETITQGGDQLIEVIYAMSGNWTRLEWQMWFLESGHWSGRGRSSHISRMEDAKSTDRTTTRKMERPTDMKRRRNWQHIANDRATKWSDLQKAFSSIWGLNG